MFTKTFLRSVSSKAAMKAERILGNTEYASEISSLEQKGWVMDKENDKMTKLFKFTDFNQVRVPAFEMKVLLFPSFPGAMLLRNLNGLHQSSISLNSLFTHVVNVVSAQKYQQEHTLISAGFGTMQ